MSEKAGFYLQQGLFAALHALCLLLALSPFDIWPLGIFAVFFLLLAAARLEKASASRVLATWLLFAFAVSLITFGWIVATIHRYTGEHITVTALLTAVYAVACQLKFLVVFTIARYSAFRDASGLPAQLAIAVVVALADAVTPELFPWSWGNALAAQPWLRQLAAIGSVYLISFFCAFAGTVLWRLFANGGASAFARLKLTWPALAACGALFLVSVILYYLPDDSHTGKIRTLVVQTNIGAAPEKRRSDREFATEAINRLFNQSLEGLILNGPAALIVWPEATMPFHSAAGDALNSSIYSETFDAAAEYTSRRARAALVFHDMYNNRSGLHSRLSVRPAAGEGDFYLKRRLVPWGEYLPLEKLIHRMREYFPEAGRFVAGTQENEMEIPLSAETVPLRTLAEIAPELGWLASANTVRARLPAVTGSRAVRVKPLICYEALHPEDARTRTAGLIINVSSDAWFGDGVEGHQHASAAMLRAVENGIPMIRAAMSGVSVVADNRGDDIVPRSGQAHSENLFAEIALTRRRTVFSRFGMAAFYAIMFAFAWPWLLQSQVLLSAGRRLRAIFSGTAKNK